MSIKRQTYTVQVAGLQRDLRIFEVAPGVPIALLNILGDTELVQACALALADKLRLSHLMSSSLPRQKAFRSLMLSLWR